MKRKILAGLMAALGVVALCGGQAWAEGESSSSSSNSSSSSSSSSGTTCGGSFLGFYPWYYGLTDSNCEIDSSKMSGGGEQIASFVWTIVLNILADVMLAVGYIAVGFVMYGGFLFIASRDNPGMVVKAQKTLTYAIIGAIIAILASTIIHAVINVL